ncbi:hypothetical protein ORF_0028 [Pseudomonas phage phiPto-bp6g]|nr:hypothetical protein ORF_0028 [Pseudomonas phage phiPto-bp6g]
MQEQLTIAVPLAIEYHGEQKYGDSDLPYIYHLNCVDQLIISAYAPKDRGHGEPYSKEPGDEIDNLRAIAFLHDILEDTTCTVFDLIDAGLSDDVINAVIAITKKGDSYEDYLRIVMSNPLALKVKTADTATNLAHSIFDKNEHRIEKYSRQLDILKGFEQL